MKRKKFFLFGLSALALFGAAGCTAVEIQPDTIIKYSVTAPTSEEFRVVGLDKDYEAGDLVTFGVVVTDEIQVVDTVSASDTTVTNSGGNIYTFTMPEKDVTLTVTLKDAIVEVDEFATLASALDLARDGVEMDGVFTEYQTYIDNAGEISSQSRYARRIISQMVPGFNQVTRYGNVYDYEMKDEPIDVSQSKPDTITMFSKHPEKGTLATSALDFTNTVQYYDVLNDASGENYKWYGTFGNLFELLTVDNFEVGEEKDTYLLKTDDKLLGDVYTGLAQIIFGDIVEEYHVQEFKVVLKDGKLSSYSGKFEKCEFEWYVSEVTFEGSFTNFGESVFTVPTVYNGEAHSELDEALNELKKQNYNVSVLTEYEGSWSTYSDYTTGASDGGKHFMQSIYDTVDGKVNVDFSTIDPAEVYYYEEVAEYDDFLEMYKYSVKQAVKIRDAFYAFSSDREGIRINPNMVPSFELSSVFFNKEGNTYTLKSAEELPYYTVLSRGDVFSPFTSPTFKDLTITLGENGDVTFVTKDGYGETQTIKYTNVGTTTVEAVKVKTDMSDFSTWEDMFKTDTIAKEATDCIPSEILNIVPIPYVSTDIGITNVSPEYMEVTSEGARSMQILCLLDTYGGNEDLQYDDLLVYFSSALGNQGFDFNEENLYEYEFLKKVQVESVEMNLSITFGGYSNYFVIGYDLTPVVEEVTQ